MGFNSAFKVLVWARVSEDWKWEHKHGPQHGAIINRLPFIPLRQYSIDGMITGGPHSAAFQIESNN